jgi:hypothetical protein
VKIPEHRTPEHLNTRIFRIVHTSITILACLALWCGQRASGQEKTLKFNGRDWIVREGPKSGPGPNEWSRSCAWVDDKGWLHLKILQHDGHWQCAEVTTKERLGFGRYQFQVIGPIDKLDKNVVLGLFPYPTPDVGPDGTNEIDIEFARWAIPTAPNGNFTVWPPTRGRKQSSHTFEFLLDDTYTTHRIIWTPRTILFQSLRGHREDDQSEISRYSFQPADYPDAIPQKPMPLHLNLWLFRGKPPSDGKEVEIVFKSISFVPDTDASAKK